MSGRPPHIPLRMCVVCRGMKPKAELLRFARQRGSGALVADSTGQVGGKGVYFCRTSECLDRLTKERKLRRMFLDRIRPEDLEWMRASSQECGKDVVG